MNQVEDFVTISDDDSPSEQCSTNKNVKVNKNQPVQVFSSNDTIILDEESYTQRNDENYNTIELKDTQEEFVSRKQIMDAHFEKVKGENELLAKFIKVCLELENSEGMLRIIEKNLLSLYNEAEETYKNSKSFQRTLAKSLHCLETDPMHKFSHVKNLVDTLKFHRAKKRVQLTTLSTTLNENKDCSLKRSSAFSEMAPIPKRPKIDNIIIDSDEETVNLVTIEESPGDSDTVVGDETQNDHQPIIRCDDKENLMGNSNSEDRESYLTPNIEAIYQLDPSKEFDLYSQMVPRDYQDIRMENEDNVLAAKIQQIESAILKQKELIRKYDEQEVTSDTVYSPYILSEKAKATIVDLYKKLCELTGQEAVKPRKVRLQVLDGHPPGPTKNLEQFINSRIGSDGDPPFPDFSDVVQCVLEASTRDGLGWNKHQVMKEASALFTQCGRALQKRRQQRAYRDLISRVKVERADDHNHDRAHDRDHDHDHDPADDDPELRRRLDENRRIATRKERELLERFTMLQNTTQSKPKSALSLDSNHNGVLPIPSLVQSSSIIPNDGSSIVSHGSSIINHGTYIIRHGSSVVTHGSSVITHGSSIINHGSSIINHGSSIINHGSSIINHGSSTISHGSTIIHHGSSTIDPAALATPSDDESESSDSDTDSLGEDEPDGTTTDHNVPLNRSGSSRSTSDVPNSDAPVKIKKEPMDVCKMLDELGDDFTTTILYIEDPTLVIDISSDSEDEHSHGEVSVDDENSK